MITLRDFIEQGVEIQGDYVVCRYHHDLEKLFYFDIEHNPEEREELLDLGIKYIYNDYIHDGTFRAKVLHIELEPIE